MTREEKVKELLAHFTLVSVLSEKNDCKTLSLRHASGRDAVLHSFPEKYDAYEYLCGIRCENLPEVYEVYPVSDGQVVLEEYIDGITVAEQMETGRRFRKSGAKKILSEICFALGLLHGRGIVHRDVKPENVMLTSAGRVVLIDFNASRTVKPAGRDTRVLGTVGYASPEQLGIAQTDERADIYALGVLYNVLLTGHHPAEGIARGRAGRIIRKCTQTDPADRFQSAADLARRL